MPIQTNKIIVIGAGPAGLMAADTIASAGFQVDVFDAMPSAGRKFLLAGKGGMNLTHAENKDLFLSRYRQHRTNLTPLLEEFDADAVRAWANDLGIDTFVGSSGRVFPVDMKAAPLLRAWLHRLRSNGVRFHMRHRWLGWQDQQWHFARSAMPSDAQADRSPSKVLVEADYAVLALGGGSWARLGSDGAWVPILAAQKIEIAPLEAANCGFNLAWSDFFRTKFAGQPITSVVAHYTDENGQPQSRQGQFVITEHGVEGSLIYALSATLREQIKQHGIAHLTLDLAPGKSPERVAQEVQQPRGSRSLSSHLQSKLGLDRLKTALLHECLPPDIFQQLDQLALAIKALPLTLQSPRPIDEAISSAGGVHFSALDAHLMLKQMPKVFCAGEMLDWEAPTGGYLLTACLASGQRAGRGVLAAISKD